MKLISKEAQNSSLIAVILNTVHSSQVMFSWRHFVQEILSKWLQAIFFNYHFGLLLLLSHIFLSHACSKLWSDSTQDSEADNGLVAKDSADLVKDAKASLSCVQNCDDQS